MKHRFCGTFYFIIAGIEAIEAFVSMQVAGYYSPSYMGLCRTLIQFALHFYPMCIYVHVVAADP